MFIQFFFRLKYLIRIDFFKIFLSIFNIYTFYTKTMQTFATFRV